MAFPLQNCELNYTLANDPSGQYIWAIIFHQPALGWYQGSVGLKSHKKTGLPLSTVLFCYSRLFMPGLIAAFTVRIG